MIREELCSLSWRSLTQIPLGTGRFSVPERALPDGLEAVVVVEGKGMAGSPHPTRVLIYALQQDRRPECCCPQEEGGRQRIGGDGVAIDAPCLTERRAIATTSSVAILGLVPSQLAPYICKTFQEIQGTLRIFVHMLQ